MDADFLVQDTYSVTRPQWKMATDLQEAMMLFGEAVAQNYKTQDAGRPIEPEEDDAESSSSDEGLEEDAMPEVDEEQESSDEAEVSTAWRVVSDYKRRTDKYQAFAPTTEHNAEQNADSEESEDEQIFVARQEEERDPAAEAEFDRELERLMADGVESRRFERKAIFDVPLPMKRSARETGVAEHLPAEEDSGSRSGSQMPANTMAFSLMTKKGNKQQVCHFPCLYLFEALSGTDNIDPHH